MGNVLLGLDIGTSSVKAGVFTPDGRLLGLGRSGYVIRQPHPGWAECDPGEWWHGTRAALRQACAAAGIEPGDVQAVGLSVLFPCVMLLDRRLRPLSPALLYCDQRSAPQAAAIAAVLPATEFAARTGNVLTPGTSAVTSLAWLRDNCPGEYRAAAHVAWTNTWLLARLTGTVAVDPSMVALSGLAEKQDPWHWSEPLCRRFGIAGDKLPPIRGAAEVAGTITVVAARATGLRPGTPVVTGCGDVPAAALGGGVTTSDTALYVAGSTDCVCVPLARPARPGSWVNCAHIEAGRWLAIGTATSSGVSVEWFCRTFLGHRRGSAARLDEMRRLAAAAPAGANGVLFLPYLQGERTPIWDADATGAFTGITVRTTPADLARAVFEGTACSLRHILADTRRVLGRTPGVLLATGGGTANGLWNQIKADVLQRPLQILGFQETGVLGAALLAGVGSGLFTPSGAAGIAARRQTRHAVVPDAGKGGLYDRLFARYVATYPAMRTVVAGLRQVPSSGNRRRGGRSKGSGVPRATGRGAARGRR